MEELDVNDNELDKLEVSGCSKLVRIDCFKNRLTADAMQKLVETLPDRSQENTAGRLFVLYSIDEKEKNEILKTSVEQAKTKKWDVKYFTGQSYGYSFTFLWSLHFPMMLGQNNKYLKF